MKKKFWLAVMAAAMALSVGVSAVFGYWNGKFMSDKNTVTVATFANIKVSGGVATGAHEADKELSAVFTVVKYLNDGKTYDLMLCDIAFYCEDTKADWAAHLTSVWEYRLTSGDEWSPLTTTEIEVCSGVENGVEATLYLRIGENAPEEYVIGTLVFSAELRESSGGGEA